MLSSKEVLEKTGISRATLNNYISSGIVPRPEVLPPEPSDGAAPRIGYFPPEIVERIEEIQRLKREGWSITRITEHFTGAAAPARSEPAARQAASVPVAAARPRAGAMPSLSFDEIVHPAYLVNSRFEVVWMNEAAASPAWPNFVPLPAESGSRGIFPSLLQGQIRSLTVAEESRKAILRLHIGLARQRGAGLSDLCRDVPSADLPVMERLYGEAESFEFPMIVRTPVLPSRPGPASPLFLYALNFREGMLFVYVPGGTGAVEVSMLLAQPDLSASDAARRPPALTQVAVLVTDLQQSSRLWSELPPAEYFELVNDIWSMVEPIFKRHHGTSGKHPGEGMVCYFLPRNDSNYLWNALAAAQQVREAMRRLSKQWQLRKGWATELFMNTGIDEGQEWHGTLRPGPQAELTVLGDAADHAASISNIARDGAMWTTRNLVGKLRADERARLKYGVRRRNRSGDEIAVASTFSRVENLADLNAPGHEALRSIARLAITEILDIDVGAGDPGSAQQSNSHLK